MSASSLSVTRALSAVTRLRVDRRAKPLAFTRTSPGTPWTGGLGRRGVTSSNRPPRYCAIRRCRPIWTSTVALRRPPGSLCSTWPGDGFSAYARRDTVTTARTTTSTMTDGDRTIRPEAPAPAARRASPVTRIGRRGSSAGCASTSRHPSTSVRAQTPSRSRPLRSTWPVASFSHSRRAVQVGDRLVAQRDDPAVVVPAVVEAGELLEVAGDAVRLAQLGRLGDDARELAERRRAARTRSRGRAARGRSVAAVDAGRPALRATARVRAWAYCT